MTVLVVIIKMIKEKKMPIIRIMTLVAVKKMMPEMEIMVVMVPQVDYDDDCGYDEEEDKNTDSGVEC